MTRAQFRSWLKQQLAWLDSTADPGFDLEEVAETVSDLVQEAARLSALCGLPECVAACQHTRSVGEARRIFSACLASLETRGPAPSTLNLNEAAAYLGMSASGLRKIVRRGAIRFAQSRKWGAIKFRREWLDSYLHPPAPSSRPNVSGFDDSLLAL